MARIKIALGTDMGHFEPTLVAMLSVLRSTPAPITVFLPPPKDEAQAG